MKARPKTTRVQPRYDCPARSPNPIQTLRGNTIFCPDLCATLAAHARNDVVPHFLKKIFAPYGAGFRIDRRQKAGSRIQNICAQATGTAPDESR